MSIVVGYPPNFEAIAARFGRNNVKNAVFAYDHIIYTPNGVQIPKHLEIHELTHFKQQGDDVKGWWQRYLDDDQFRLEQEIEAYQAQYQYLQEHHPRIERRFILKKICEDLAGPMYGNLITKDEAKEAITS